MIHVFLLADTPTRLLSLHKVATLGIIVLQVYGPSLLIVLTIDLSDAIEFGSIIINRTLM